MRKKQALVILMVVLALFIVGCTDTNTVVTSSPFVGGTKGLSFEFLVDQPPTEIYDNGDGEFAIGIQITNEGEHEVEASEGYIEIEGISSAEYGVPTSDFTQDIPPLRRTEKDAEGNIQDGGMDIVSFDGLSYQADIEGNLDNTVIRAVACYNYKTRASSQVCVKEVTRDQASEDDVCDITGSKAVSSSGGPIQVTQVVESPYSGNGIQLAFTVTNNGAPNDRFFKEDTACDRRVTNSDKNLVYVDVSAINNGQFNARCSGFKGGNGGNAGYVYLPGGESRKVICTFDTDGADTDFITPANIELSYRYMQYIETPILIKNLGFVDE